MKPIEPITRQHLDQLTADPNTPATHRAIWRLLFETDLRLGDLLSLDVRDVDPDRHLITGTNLKYGSREVSATISSAALGLLREVIGGRDAGPLFLGRSGNALPREAAERAPRRYADFSIHAFRSGGRLDRVA